jgi:hypothetical protein
MRLLGHGHHSSRRDFDRGQIQRKFTDHRRPGGGELFLCSSAHTDEFVRQGAMHGIWPVLK